MDTRKPSLKGRKYKKYHDDNNKELSNGNLYDLIKSKHMQRVVRETEYFLVCWNLFQYDLWDGCEVEKHYLVIPKRFVDSVAKFTPEESEEYFKILAYYETKGFSFYARDPKNKQKTVKHQHTHLLKMDFSKKVNWVINWCGKFMWWGLKK